MFCDAFHSGLEGKLHLRKDIAFNTDWFFCRDTMCPGKIFGEIPAEGPVPIFVRLLKKDFQLPNIVDKCSVSVGHKAAVAINVLFLSFANVTVDQELLFAELPCCRDIAGILKPLNDFGFFDTESREKADKLLALADALSSTQLVLIGVI